MRTAWLATGMRPATAWALAAPVGHATVAPGITARSLGLALPGVDDPAPATPPRTTGVASS